MRDRTLGWIAELTWRRPVAIIVAAALTAAACAFYAARTLILDANTDNLIAPDRPFMQPYRAFLDEFGDLEYIHAVVDSGADAQRARMAVEAIEQRLRQLPPGQSPGVYGGIDPDEQLRLATRAWAPGADGQRGYAMSDDELRGLIAASDALAPLVRRGAGEVVHRANELLAQLVQRGAQMSRDEQERHGAAAVLLLSAIAASREGGTARGQLGHLIDPPPRQYFTSDTGRMYFITVMPVKDYTTLSVIEGPLQRIRAVLDEVRREFPDLQMGLTGKPVLQADEMATTNLDMTRAALLGVALVAALFMLAFGGIWRPLLAVMAFACAACWTYGVAAAMVGRLNLLSIVFMLVLVGVGLDYGIHVISRYREARRGMEVRRALIHASVNAARGNLTGACTSSAVFFTALLTTFQGLRELGLIAGFGLLLCMLSMTVVLPALLALFDRCRADSVHAGAAGTPDSTSVAAARDPRLLRWLTLRPVPVLLATGAVTIGLLLAPGGFHFERNLLNLQAAGLESIEWERRIVADSASASWFGAVIADDQQQALRIIERAKSKPAIGAINSVFDLVEPETAERSALREQLREVSRPALQGDAQQPGAENVNEPRDWSAADLNLAVTALQMMALGAASQAPEEARMLSGLADDLKHLAERMQPSRPPAISEPKPSASVIPEAVAPGAASAQEVRAVVERTVERVGRSLRLILEGNAMDLRSALPDALRDQYVSPAGRYLVMLHPGRDVWEYEPMKQFIAALREVDPHVTGAPITHFESLGEMQRSFLHMAIYAALVIALIVLIDFRSLKFLLLALLPTTIGLMWLVQAMGLFGVSFNLANFFSVPILIGLSVDGSVHVLHRYREGGPERLNLGATRRAVIVTAFTTMIGFGCLMLAHHRGLRSLGQVMAMGTAACLLATVIILPSILALIERSHGEADKKPGG